jgi:EmrB/QacA subfamily drug resistance transporter
MTAKSSKGWVLALTAVASLIVALDALVVTTALSTIRADLDASIEQLEWTVNAYNLSFAVLLLTAAALGDRFGRRRLFAAGLALFTAASAACALAPDIGALIAARAIQGAGAALVTPLSLAIVSAAFPPERRGSAIGILMGVTGLAVASGPLVGGAIAQGLAWQWIFWVNVPIGVVTLPLILLRLDESFGADSGLDIGGVVLATGGALGLVWGLVRGNSAGWGSAEVVAALVAGAILLVAFVAWELRAREPMLPMRLFRSRPFSVGNAASFLATASLFGTVFFMAQFLQTAMGYGPLGAGLRLLPWTVTLSLCAPLAGALADRIGVRPFIVGGLFLQGVGFGWVALIADPSVAYGELIAPMVVAGVGISMALPAFQSAVVSAVAPEAIGKAAGVNSTMRQLGGVFGIAILVAVFAGAGGYASAQAFSDGFAPAIGVSAGLSLLGALVATALPRRRGASAPAAVDAAPILEGGVGS